MTSTPKNDNSKQKPEIGLGAQTDSGYKYSSRINFKEDLSVQITRLMQEKKAKDELEIHLKQIRRISLQFKNKEKNLNYYRAIGKALSFLNISNFKNIKPYSIFRRIIDEIPDILPGLDAKRIRDHLMMMYRIGELEKSVLSKATWEQWYEISKFKNVISDKKTLSKVLAMSGTTSGPDLREKIRSLLNK